MSDEVTDAVQPTAELDTKTTVIKLRKPRVQTEGSSEDALPKMQPVSNLRASAANQTIKLSPTPAAQSAPAPIKLTPVTSASEDKPKATIKLTPPPASQGAPAPIKLTPVTPAAGASPKATIKLTPPPVSQSAPAPFKPAPTPAPEGAKANATIKLKPQQPTQPTPAPAALKLTPSEPENVGSTDTVSIKSRRAAKSESKAAEQTIKLTPAAAGGVSPAEQTIKLTPTDADHSAGGMKTMKLTPSGGEKTAGKTISLKAVLPKTETDAEPGGFVPSFAADALSDKTDDRKYEPGIAFMIVAIASMLILAFSAFVMFAQYMNMYEDKDINVPGLERLVPANKAVK